LVKIKDFLISSVATKDSTYKEKQDGLESQLKELVSRFEALKAERASDLLRIDKLLADNEDLASRLTQSTDAKNLADKNFQVLIEFPKIMYISLIRIISTGAK
jgi:hypothetical protein